METVKLYYFKPAEFHRGVDWFDLMDTRLLVLLDSLRHQWRQPIYISQHDDALGRRQGDSYSQHNIERWGEVRAADIIPRGIRNDDDANRFVYLATDVGFTGIGVYPDWNQGVGLHLDTRIDAKPGSPAVWGAVNNEMGQQRYVTITEALEAIA